MTYANYAQIILEDFLLRGLRTLEHHVSVDVAAGNGRFISRLRAKGERAVEGGRGMDCSYVRNDAGTRQVWLMIEEEVENEPSLRSRQRLFIKGIRNEFVSFGLNE